MEEELGGATRPAQIDMVDQATKHLFSETNSSPTRNQFSQEIIKNGLSRARKGATLKKRSTKKTLKRKAKR